MIKEQMSEKLNTQIQVVSKPIIPDYEYHIRVMDFEKSVLAIVFFSLVASLLILVL